MPKQTKLTKESLAKLRQKMTIPQMSEHLKMGARKLEKLLAKFKIKKYK